MAPVDRATADDAVRAGDLDELLRVIDACCEHREWDVLAALRVACERSHETGRQLWPAASHAAYRLALEAPPPFAASVLVDTHGRFAPGPLPEVAAQAHTWLELAPHVVPGPAKNLAAHERVLRGEDVRGNAPAGPVVLELPWTLEAWEPRYELAEYHAHRAEFPAPPAPRLSPGALPANFTRADADDVTHALADATRVWTTESNGRVHTAAARGDAMAAIAALGPRSARIVEVPGADALAHVAWAGASGGAHGRRRGAAAGRFGAWWLAGALAGALDDWPADGARLEQAVSSCRWYLWDAAEPATGWSLQLAIEDPSAGRSWAVSAHDAR
jgi:hypothetical protein